MLNGSAIEDWSHGRRIIAVLSNSSAIRLNSSPIPFFSSFSVCLFFCAYGREQVKTEGAITVEVKKRKKKKLNNSLGNICKEGRKDVRNQELRVGWNSDRRQLDLGIYSG